MAQTQERLPEEVVAALAHLLRELRFGSIEIVVHDGRITQIERREKVRIAADAARPTRNRTGVTAR
ncbi:MAG: DUF2292 domain-containing protein [Proteobacteria bacterium]|nr:MAG: DUF2292 domain-containing protein [Pseudomonadota bacterium]